MVLRGDLVLPGDAGDQLDGWCPGACGAHQERTEPARLRCRVRLGHWRHTVSDQHVPVLPGPDPSDFPYLSVHSTGHHV